MSDRVEIFPTADWIKQNYDSTIKLIQSANLVKLENLLQSFGDRYALCPASGKKEYFSAFPGGLCFHNLNTLKWFYNFSKITEIEVSKETMIKLSILHDIGKLGTKNVSYYLRQDGEYYDKKGFYYEINPEIQYMRVCDRSLFLIQEYEISLSEEEYLAILLCDAEDNEFYKYKEPKLAMVLRNAVQWTRKLEKDNIVRWPE